MLKVQTQEILDMLHDLYPGWNPTATQLEAVRHKLVMFEVADAKEAVLATYDPAKRVAPLDVLFSACVRTVAARKKEAQRQESEQPSGPLVTDEQRRQILIDGAEKGNGVCMALCRKRGIAFKVPEHIPF